MNLFENILQKVSNQNSITHILSYDLTGKDLTFYWELDELIREEFPWAKKPLETFWEISTDKTSSYIRDLVVRKAWTKSKVNVYKVQILEKSTHPVILKPQISQ